MSRDIQSGGKLDAYEDRNLAMLSWFKMVQENGLGRVGFYDDDDSSEGWVVVVCECQEFGQVSYHCPKSFADESKWLNRVESGVWDGHSREEKNNRLKDFVWENFTA